MLAGAVALAGPARRVASPEGHGGWESQPGAARITPTASVAGPRKMRSVARVVRIAESAVDGCSGPPHKWAFIASTCGSWIGTG